MGAPNAAELLNLVGFITGAALCAMLLSLVVQARATADRSDTLPLATAVLGLLWNLGELGDYLLNRAGRSGPESWLSAVSFAALATLAAVVVHSVARDVRHGRIVIVMAYVFSAAATVLQLSTIASGDARPSALAFTLLTVAFGTIALPLAVLTRGQTNGRRALWMLALALFDVSANHLGHFHDEAGGWMAELIGHHAVLPLAFAILYQEYRFALADLFLKRALTLLAVVAIALSCYAGLGALPPGPLPLALLLACWVLTAVFYPTLRQQLSHFVDTALLDRQNYAQLRAELTASLQDCETVDGVLDRTAAVVARAMNARRVWWVDDAAPEATDARITTEIEVPTTEAPRPRLRVGDLVGGRRLLSDDRAFLDAAALTAARRVDAVRLTIERFDQRLREEEMERLATEAELRALRSQINPHFLFNALTTIGYLIESAPPRALKTLLRLTSLLRSVLRSEGEMTTLGRELELVEHYLDIERERFEERLQVHLDVPPALRALAIPCLIVQPLVENAIKHGIAPALRGGEVRVQARLQLEEGRQTLVVSVLNTGAPLSPEPDAGSTRVGLNNVERRLAGHFGERASLTLSARDGQTVAEVRLPVAAAGTAV
ncbi:MAG: histidine kinase, partial [Acidobacteria bacterium]|nr:histidine kinase [Acidobacteriota bacterium]